VAVCPAFISFVRRRFNKALCRTFSVCSLPGGWWVWVTPFQSRLYWPSPEFDLMSCLHQSPAACDSLRVWLIGKKVTLTDFPGIAMRLASNFSLRLAKYLLLTAGSSGCDGRSPARQLAVAAPHPKLTSPGYSRVTLVTSGGRVHAIDRALQSASPAGNIDVSSW